MAAIDQWRKDKERWLGEMKRAMTLVTDAALQSLYDEMRGEIGMIDHTLADLRRLDHPYAWRHEAGNLHPDYLVHEQKGDLLGGLKKKDAVTQGESVVGEIHNESDHAWHVILGTVRMRPRDYVTASMIVQRGKISDLYERAHAAIHDEPGDEEFLMDLERMAHDRYPAQLPEE